MRGRESPETRAPVTVSSDSRLRSARCSFPAWLGEGRAARRRAAAQAVARRDPLALHGLDLVYVARDRRQRAPSPALVARSLRTLDLDGRVLCVVLPGQYRPAGVLPRR